MTTDPFARLGYLMARWRWVVIGFWVAVIGISGALFAPQAASSLVGGGFVLPGSESDEADVILAEEFNASTASNALLVFETPEGLTIDDPAVAAEITAALERVAALEDVEAVTSFYTTGDSTFVSADRTTLVAVASLLGTESETQEHIHDVREQLEDVESVEHYVTGTPAINFDIQETSESDLRRAEMFTIPIILVLLLFVFRTVIAAAVPLILGASAVVVTLAILFLASQFTDVSIFALNVASMIGLGLGVDFSLIVVSRYREELKRGLSVQDAVALTMATSGRSITYSAVTVFVGMIVLTVLFGLMIVRSVSLGVLLVAMTALLAGLTLLPAVLAALGHRIDALRVIPQRKREIPTEQGFWYRLSHAIMDRPVIWLGVSLVILGALAIPIKDLRFYGSTAEILPTKVESRAGVDAIAAAFGENRISPIQIVVETGAPNGAWSPEFLAAVAELTAQLTEDPRVADVFSLSQLAPGLTPEQFSQLTPADFTADPQSAAATSQFVNIQGDNDIGLITLTAAYPESDERHEQLVYDLRDEVLPEVAGFQADEVLVGGDSARVIDFRDFLYGRFPLLVAGVMAVTFIILMMFFQSVFLPIKAIFMNLLSIVATYGALSLIFIHGWGAGFVGLEDPIERIGILTPAILFAVLFGLSTDYEVFMLSRVKEYYHETQDNEESVATGLEHTASVITAAGLILIGTFGSFAIAGVVTVKEIGLGLAIGALIDSTVVRVIMVPATMKLMGNINWWMPGWLKRIVPELSEGPSGGFPAPQPALAAAGDGGVLVAATTTAGDTGAGHAVPQPSARSAGPPVAPARLVNAGGSVGVDIIPLDPRYPFRIGRDDDSELQLFDARISRNHALIDFDGRQWRVTDLESTNGVRVNHEPVQGTVPLRNGDRIEIGNMGTVLFDFEQAVPARAM